MPFLSKIFKRKPKKSLQQQVVEATAPPSRYEACQILRAAGIPSKAWLDDASLHFGQPVILQALFILVSDTASASVKLQEAGYVSAKDNSFLMALYSDKMDMNAFYFPPNMPKQPRLLRGTDVYIPDPRHPVVGVLSAQEYCYDFAADALEDGTVFPTLVDYLVAMITRYLRAGEDDFADRVMAVSYLQQLYLSDEIPQLKEPGFEELLPAKYRQFHSDQVNRFTLTQLTQYETQQMYVKQVAAFESGATPETGAAAAQTAPVESGQTAEVGTAQ